VDFVGRQDDFSWLASHCEPGSVVTIVGPPGVGKTALARRFHARAEKAVFADLRLATSREDIAYQLARALALHWVPEIDASTQVGLALSRRGPLLVVLDNVEQVAEVTAELLARWRDVAPVTRWILTSTRATHATAEHVLQLRPLGLPSDVSRVAIETSEAGQLLLQQAGSAACEDTAGVHALLHALGGIPLAIRVAARRLPHLGARGLCENLSLAIRGQPSEHEACLMATLCTSWRLLTPNEQLALTELSVFEGGFDLPAAQAVLTRGDHAVNEIAALCAFSLLQAETLPDASTRYSLLPVIAVFAEQQRLGNEALTRHASYFCEIGPKNHDLACDGSVTASRWIQRETENLLAVITRVKAKRISSSFRLGATYGLGGTRESASRPRDTLSLLDAALHSSAANDNEGSSHAHARWRAILHSNRAEARFMAGDVPGAMADLDSAAALAAGDEWACARISIAIGMAARFQNRLAESGAAYAQALKHAQNAFSPHLEIEALLGLSIVARRGEHDDKGTARLSQALALARRHGFHAIEGEILTQQAICDWERGLTLEAYALMLEAIALCHAAEKASSTIYALTMASGIALYDGDWVRAETHADAALSLAMKRGLVALEIDCHGLLAVVAELRGDSVIAERRFSSAIAAARRVNVAGRELVWTCTLVFFAALRGATEAATRSLARFDGLAMNSAEKLAHDLAKAALALEAGEAQAKQALSEIEPRLVPSSPVACALYRRLADHLEHKDGPRTGRLLKVASDAAWFVAPGSARRIELASRKPLRRLLAALVDHRVNAPGEPLSSAQLIAQCWPGEHAQERSARARLHSAVSTLRRLGLHDVVHRSPNGYFLRPEVPCVRE
jgi:predicted ATPase